MNFQELGINKYLVNKLLKNNITKPSLVQERTIPFILKGKDIVVQAETGSGKTICFALPILQKINKNIEALVIVPTRELAKQVGNEFNKFSINNIKSTIIYGGVSIERQFKEIQHTNIIVGTPGRLLDLIKRSMLNLKHIKFLVLDEADRMLDMGFIEDIKKIISYIPKKRQTMLFSATINKKVMTIVKDYLINPVKVILENKIKTKVLKQYYYNVPQKDKIPLLINILKNEKGLSLVFCSTKRSTEYVSKLLNINNIKAKYMNGNMTQSAREKVLDDFSSGKINVLVATDVAARGIHVNDIRLVINFDLPMETETYTHRIGRTARQGKTGKSIIILSERDYLKMTKIQNTNKEIKRLETPNLKRVRFPKLFKKKKIKKNYETSKRYL